VTFLHTLLDAMGLAGLFKAWTAVLRGQEDEVPAFHGFDKDPLVPLSETTPAEKYIFSGRVLKGLRMLIFVLHYIFELVWYRKDAERVVFISSQYLQYLREKVLQELDSESKKEEKSFVSESDILFSWWSQITLSALKPAPERMVLLMNVFDIRPTLAGDLVSPNSVFIANAFFPIYTFLSACQVLNGPLSFVASQLRRSLEQQRTREQVQAFAALQKRSLDKTGNALMIGYPSVLLIICSNWHKGRFFEVDFSAAVIAPGVPLTQRANKLGRPSYINVIRRNHGFSTPNRNGGPVIGKDAAGNWWLVWTMRTEAWPAVEKQLKAITNEESGLDAF